MADKLHASTTIVDEGRVPTRAFFILLDELIDVVNVTIPAMQAEIDALEALVASHHP